MSVALRQFVIGVRPTRLLCFATSGYGLVTQIRPSTIKYFEFCDCVAETGLALLHRFWEMCGGHHTTFITSMLLCTMGHVIIFNFNEIPITTTLLYMYSL